MLIPGSASWPVNVRVIDDGDVCSNAEHGASAQDLADRTIALATLMGFNGTVRNLPIALNPVINLSSRFAQGATPCIDYNQTSVTDGGTLRFLVPTLPIGAKILGVSAYWGNQNTTNVAIGTMPRLQLYRRVNTIGVAFINAIGNGTEATIGTVTDTTAVLATYKLIHAISITGLAQVVGADDEYAIDFRGETGANSTTGGTLIGLRMTVGLP